MTTNTEQLLSELASEALLTLDGIADTNPRDRADFENKDEWITWAKSRAKWAADKLRAPISRELLAERVLKQMLEQDAALTQPAQAGEMPEGWQWVPVEPTPEMLEAGLKRKALEKWTDGYSAIRSSTEHLRPTLQVAAIQWQAMLTAAPQAPALDAGVVQNAKRYEWLRRCRGQEHDPLFTVQHEVDGTLWGGDLDHAIDAAMSAQGGGK